MQWIKLTDRMPNPDVHERVLICTEGYDFGGEQVFDVKAETLKLSRTMIHARQYP